MSDSTEESDSDLSKFQFEEEQLSGFSIKERPDDQHYSHQSYVCDKGRSYTCKDPRITLPQKMKTLLIFILLLSNIVEAVCNTIQYFNPIVRGDSPVFDDYPDCPGRYLYPQHNQRKCFTCRVCEDESQNKHPPCERKGVSGLPAECISGHLIHCPKLNDPEHGQWKSVFGQHKDFVIYTEFILQCSKGFKPSRVHPVLFCTDEIYKSMATWNSTADIQCISIHHDGAESELSQPNNDTHIHVLYIVLVSIGVLFVVAMVFLVVIYCKKMFCFAKREESSSDTCEVVSDISGSGMYVNQMDKIPDDYPLMEKTCTAASIYHNWVQSLLNDNERMVYLCDFFKRPEQQNCTIEKQLKKFLGKSDAETKTCLEQWQSVCQPTTGILKLIHQEGQKTKENYMNFLIKEGLHLPTNFWDFDEELQTGF